MSPQQSQVAGFSIPGFNNPIFDSTDVFRKVLSAMSRPGEIQNIKAPSAHPESLNPTSSAILLALADMETEVWLAPEMDSIEARNYLKFHTGCKVVEDPKDSKFAVVNTDTGIDVYRKLAVGSAEYPDRSATVIMMVDDISNDSEMTLKGPGIKVSNSLKVEHVAQEFWHWFEENSRLFPCGVDVIFASTAQIAAIPRTIKVEHTSCM